jgi:hypothetical protein
METATTITSTATSKVTNYHLKVTNYHLSIPSSLEESVGRSLFLSDAVPVPSADLVICQSCSINSRGPRQADATLGFGLPSADAKKVVDAERHRKKGADCDDRDDYNDAMPQLHVRESRRMWHNDHALNGVVLNTALAASRVYMA